MHWTSSQITAFQTKMPKRGGRNRGGSLANRGGRGGRFRFTNGKKKKSKGRSNNHRGNSMPNYNVPELMDLEDNVYIPEIGSSVPKGSMRSLSRRPARQQMFAEAQYTDKHIEQTVNQPLRKRGIEFVKAKEVYDPSADLFKKMNKSNTMSEKEGDIVDGMNSLNVENLQSPTDSNSDGYTLPKESVSKGLETEITPDDLSGSIDKKTDEEVTTHKTEFSVPVPETEDTSSESDEKTSSSKNDTSKSDPTKDDATTKIDPVDPIDFVIDTEGDKEILSSAAVSKPPTYALVDRPKPAEPVPGTQLEHDPYLTVGNVSLHTKRDHDGNTTTSLMTSSELTDIRSGFIDERSNNKDFGEGMSDISDDDVSGYKDYIKLVMDNMLKENSDYDDDDVYESDTNFDIMASSSSSDEDEDSDAQSSDNDVSKDPEYGFLPEDYEFDVSQLDISNVRLGLKNQYYAKNFELTGSMSDFMWIDEDELFDFVILKGVKEHRLHSYMKFATKGLIDEDEFSQPDYSDVYISESSEDEEDDDVSQEGDNLDDLLQFSRAQAQRQQGYDEIDFPSTQSIETTGKGKKKKLKLDRFDLENDLIESLQDQYQTHREAKKNKKSRKEEEKLLNGLANDDLRIKYPYSLHIRDIRDEFENFLHDSNRQDMSFPPLDPHGNKTICKMATCYNMKSSKNGGNGLKSFIKVSKNRKTFHYLPKFDQVGNILRQRPIFNRTDAKRPKDEIDKTDGKRKDKQRRRTKPENKAVAKEGDIVGINAPEIDRNNIGRQLLEKLGWTQGEGLGAHGNKGSSDFVLAKVKKTKTGLK